MTLRTPQQPDDEGAIIPGANNVKLSAEQGVDESMTEKSDAAETQQKISPKLYSRELAGRYHENEDSHYTGTIELADSKELKLAMVADGCSGYSGRAASQFIVKFIPDYLREHLSPDSDIPAIIRAAIIAANKDLHSRSGTRTTLDLVLTNGSEQFYTAHLGDSRISLLREKDGKTELEQLTKDESIRGEPTNYLGALYTDHGVKIDERIAIQTHKFDDSIRGILLATDGLDERLTEEEILKAFDKKNVTESLEELFEGVSVPKAKLDDRAIRMQMARIIDSTLTPDQYMSASFLETCRKAYRDEVEAIIKIVDSRLKFDDTSVVYMKIRDARTEKPTVPNIGTEEDNGSGIVFDLPRPAVPHIGTEEDNGSGIVFDPPSEDKTPPEGIDVSNMELGAAPRQFIEPEKPHRDLVSFSDGTQGVKRGPQDNLPELYREPVAKPAEPSPRRDDPIDFNALLSDVVPAEPEKIKPKTPKRIIKTTRADIARLLLGSILVFGGGWAGVKAINKIPAVQSGHVWQLPTAQDVENYITPKSTEKSEKPSDQTLTFSSIKEGEEKGYIVVLDDGIYPVKGYKWALSKEDCSKFEKTDPRRYAVIKK